MHITATGTEIFAHVVLGGLVTETDCGAWTMLHALGTVEDDAGDHYRFTGDGAAAVAASLASQIDEIVTAEDIRRAWTAVRG